MSRLHVEDDLFGLTEGKELKVSYGAGWGVCPVRRRQADLSLGAVGWSGS
jgi:hypothetical protein